MIDKFYPEFLYSDGALPFGTYYLTTDVRNEDKSCFKAGLEAVAYLYNSSVMKNGKNIAVYAQKDKLPETRRIGILDIEKKPVARR